MDMLLLRGIVHVLVFLLGLSLVTSTVVSAMLTFALPHSAPDLLTRAVFGGMRWLFTLRLRRTHTYLERDRVLELYAPLSLLSLPLSPPSPTLPIRTSRPADQPHSRRVRRRLHRVGAQRCPPQG